jgi:hypothetical protein
LRTACPPLKACRRANSSRQSLFFRLVHFTDVRCWRLADIGLYAAHVCF